MLQSRIARKSLLGRRHNLTLLPVRTSIWENYRHGPGKKYEPQLDWNKILRGAFSKEGFLQVKRDVIKITKEIFTINKRKVVEPMVVDYHEHFDTEESFKRWKITTDSKYGDGYSKAKLERSKGGHALFSGVIDNRVPKDGITMQAGFAGLGGPKIFKYMFFEHFYDWTEYTHMKLRIRGDGRTYHVSVNVSQNYDTMCWFENFVYPLYTHGGPYWQEVSIPFVDFIHSNKGFAQDHQKGLPANIIKFVAIIICDKVDGPFQLEIDYIGVYKDNSGRHYKEFISPYEQYATPQLKLQPKQWASR